MLVVLCSIWLTVRSRHFLVGEQRPYSWAFPATLAPRPGLPRETAPATASALASSTTSVRMSDEAAFTGTAADTVPAPRCPSTASSGPPAGSAAATGWKRTLPGDVLRCAAWFDSERSLRQIYDDVPRNGTVWLTFANWAFRNFALNWAAHVYRLRIERSMAIAALDRPFQQLLLDERLPYFAFDHGMTGDLRSNVSGFRRLGALKGTLVLQVLQALLHALQPAARRRPYPTLDRGPDPTTSACRCCVQIGMCCCRTLTSSGCKARCPSSPSSPSTLTSCPPSSPSTLSPSSSPSRPHALTPSRPHVLTP